MTATPKTPKVNMEVNFFRIFTLFEHQIKLQANKYMRE